jgi:AsmA protein
MSPVNLDDYMAPAAPLTQQIPPVVTAEQDADVEIPLPIDLLRTLGLNGIFEIEKVTLQNITVTNISIKTQAGNGLLAIKPVTMNLLKGRMEMGIDLDVRQTPAYTITVNANDLHAGPIVNPVLKGMMGDEEIKIEGAVQLTADIKTHGSSLLALKKAATGHVNFDMNQTSVTGVDIQYFARNVVVDYLEQKKLNVSPEWRGEYTPKQTTAFRKIHASAIVAQGKISNDDFILDSKRIKVTGKGEVDIVNNAIDYNVLIDLGLERKKTFAEKLLDEPIGIHIHGPFKKLAIEPDTKRLAKAAKKLLAEKAKAEIREKVETEMKKLKKKARQEKEGARKKVEDKLKSKFKGLFK